MPQKTEQEALNDMLDDPTVDNITTTGVTVLTSSTQILAARAGRKFLSIQNASGTPVWLAFGTDNAVSEQGFKLWSTNDQSEIFRMEYPCIYAGAVNGLSAGPGSQIVYVIEGW
jgi:hypothetical protein